MGSPSGHPSSDGGLVIYGNKGLELPCTGRVVGDTACDSDDIAQDDSIYVSIYIYMMFRCFTPYRLFLACLEL